MKREINIKSQDYKYNKVLLSYAAKIRAISKIESKSDKNDEIKNIKDDIVNQSSNIIDTDYLKVLVISSILCDLLKLNWDIRIYDKIIKLSAGKDRNKYSTKEKIRESHLIERDNQLKEDSVKAFIRKMECRTLTDKGWHSIFSVMRDGNELAKQIEKRLQNSCNNEEAYKNTNDLIDPYIQFFEPDQKCLHTGLILSDIWRYFRHTWVTVYRSVPGRSMPLLIRDAAAKNHPVIGIALLGSSSVQSTVRDKWIGWDSDTLLAEIRENPSKKYLRWIYKSLDEFISDIFIDDLLEREIITTLDIKHPSITVIAKLEKYASRCRQKHAEYPQKNIHKLANSPGAGEEIYQMLARTNLFSYKRASTLAELLKLKLIFEETNLLRLSKAELNENLNKPLLKTAIRKILFKVKARHVGINMMDLIVCGSIAPYNDLLGGKLVSMLTMSSEVITRYNNKYKAKVSIIASSMKGMPVIRKPKLVWLGTTSLYEQTSSQYNRIRIPLSFLEPGNNGALKFCKLGKTEGYGNYHFGSDTIRLMEVLTSRHSDKGRVNSIFGEGVNPLMRKIKGALEILKLPELVIMKHDNKRIVYGIPLADNYREILLGISKIPRYYINLNDPIEVSAKIADYWKRRWFSMRIMTNKNILDNIRDDTHSYPITHRAKVYIKKDDEQLEIESL